MSAYVERISDRAYQVRCPDHPRFVRVAWTRPTVPTESATDHNEREHDGAPVEIIDAPDSAIRTLLPA